MADEKVRATQLETGDARIKAGSIRILATPEMIFSLLANPKRHADFDGSGTIQRNLVGPDRLYLGAKFGMAMKIKFPYRITNTCIAFEEGRKISWRHFARHEWSYELTPIGQSETIVTETFDGRPSLSQFWLRVLHAYPNNQRAILKTLVRLKKIAEAS